MMKKTVFAFTLSCLLASPAFSHGYITEPASRAANCKTGKNPAHVWCRPMGTTKY